ncbi:PQQ-dependent sugar dehydrogenase [Haloferula sp.]|uniref:PQQ-dependent sugar dehydrogenase n=1 Tax=Haloferula sp. TaxID=2497595 RepID=UPI00329C582B
MKTKPNPIQGNWMMKLGLISFGSLSLLLLADSAHGQLVGGQTIGIDFASPSPVFGTANDVDPAAGTNFNAFDIQTADSASALFVGTLINNDGDDVTGVGFSITNNMGKASGLTSVGGTSGPAPFDDTTIYVDTYGAANVGNGSRADAGTLPGGANLVFTFTGLNDALTYTVSGGFDSDNDNFNTTWDIDGQSATTDSNGGDGYITLSNLTTDGSGNLAITVTKSVQLFVAGLTLTADAIDGGLNFPTTVPDAGYTFPNAFPGLTFNRMTSLDTLSSQPEKLFVTDGTGEIWMIPDVTAATPTRISFLDRTSEASSNSSSGMNGIAFHPDFETNGYFYIVYISNTSGWTRLSRFTVADPANITTVDNNTEHVLIEANFTRNHGFNSPAFGPDGYLYFAVGDGSQHVDFGVPVDRLTQTIDGGFWSAVHRIDVDKKAGNYEPQNITGSGTHDGFTLPTTNGLARYSIPADNPFLDQVAADGTGISTYYGKAADPARVRTEMYGIGQRSPWKMGFVPDPITGDKTSSVWVADVMLGQKERYYILPMGGNAGWAFYSGTDDAEKLQTDEDIPAVQGFQYVQPIVEYEVNDRFATGGNKSIIGGDFYQSTDIPALTGAFIMADFNRGDIWAVHRDDHLAFQLVDPVDNGETDPEVGTLYGLDDVGIAETTINGVFDFGMYEAEVELLGTESQITAMAASPLTGEMFLADLNSKIVRKLVFNQGDFDSQMPQTLSDTGAFTDVENLVVNPEMIPYDVNLSFWSDNAIKTRFINMVDAAGPILFSEDDFWQFPEGAITMKHFEMDLDRDNPGTNVKRIETRFLVKTADDFLALTYQWNETETEATLVPSSGANVDLPITEGGSTNILPWRIPSRGDCVQCHTDNNEVMLGFNTRQLNHDGELDGVSGNFLTLLETAGYLSAIGADPASLPSYVKPSDTAVNVEERVQSYLAVNCAYCHYDGNGGVPSSWSGEHHLTIEETNLLHGQALGNGIVDPTDRLVIPGDTLNSMILSRAGATNGYDRMPPLASSVVDAEGVALLTDWINNYANAKPTLDAAAGPYTVAENTSASTSVGSGPSVSDLDSSDPTRGTLLYSIVGGNTGGYFDINPTTGEITVVQDGLDYEETTSRTLSILVSDGFAPNPGEVMTNVVVDVSDVVGDDSQGDGIEDEWAMANFGFSAIDPAGDTDKDGSAELFEFWADSDPNDPSSRGLVIAPYEVTSDPGNEGYSFEWTIRADLTIGTDYEVQGSSDLGFVDLEPVTDFTVISSDPVDNGEGPALTRMRVKVPTTSGRYFLRLSSGTE